MYSRSSKLVKHFTGSQKCLSNLSKKEILSLQEGKHFWTLEKTNYWMREDIYQWYIQIRGWHPKCVRNSHNTKHQTTQLKNGQRTWIDLSPKRTYRWPIDIWKDAQHHLSSSKQKLKPQWEVTSHLSEWLSSINQQTSVREDVKKREPSCTVSGKADWSSHYGK